MKAARVVFDFGKFGAAAMGLRPFAASTRSRRAVLGRTLLHAMLQESPTGTFLVGLPEDAFDAAHEILSGSSDDPDILAAAAELDEESFHDLLGRAIRLVPTPDPAFAGEFI